MKGIGLYAIWLTAVAIPSNAQHCGRGGCPPVGEGQTCSYEIPCWNGLKCSSPSLKETGKCVKFTPIGGQCTEDANCDYFNFCDSDTKTCQKYITQGGTCTKSQQCYKSDCINKICRRTDGGAGAYCFSSVDCKNGLVCKFFVGSDGGHSEFATCNVGGEYDPGTICHDNSDCRYNNAECKKSVCNYAPGGSGAGVFCTSNAGCASGKCEVRFDAGSPIPITQCA